MQNVHTPFSCQPSLTVLNPESMVCESHSVSTSTSNPLHDHIKGSCNGDCDAPGDEEVTNVEIQKMTFEDINSFQMAESILAGYQQADVSDSTRERYMHEGARYFQNHAAVFETGSKSTYYLTKASIVYYAIEMIKVAIRDENEELFWWSNLTLQRFYSAAPSTDAETDACPIESATPRLSKRASLKFLPKDWMHQMLAGATGQHRLWILILATAGVRPQEIVNGIHIKPHQNGVIFTINSAKSDRGYGQPIRKFYVDSEFARELATLGEQYVQAKSANTISQWVGKRARKLFGSGKNSASAICFRHQFASDLKASKTPKHEISAMLGHSSSKTKKRYGIYSLARNPIKAKLIYATREVQHNESVGFIVRHTQKLLL